MLPDATQPRARRRSGAVVMVALLAVVWVAGSVRSAEPLTSRVSVSPGGADADGDSHDQSISADGRLVAFRSEATNLVEADSNGFWDVFVHDLDTGVTARVSAGSAGEQAGDGESSAPSISPDGRFVAFQSNATNLVADDTNGHLDVFVHDRDSGETTRVNLGPDGGQASDGDSFLPSISDGGRVVAFMSTATNLVDGDTNGLSDVFVHDRDTGHTSRVSVGAGGEEASDGDSYDPAISADGRFVAFESAATNLVKRDGNGSFDVFVHDRETGVTTRVSSRSGGKHAADGQSGQPAISADGRFVAFESSATNLVEGDTNEISDIFVHDRKTGETSRVSVAPGGEQALDGYNAMPAISGDGRFVAFESGATNLADGDTNEAADIFVHDRETAQTIRVSFGADGATAADGWSYAPAISSDARFVAFHSAATNILEGDLNGAEDIFVSGLLP